MGWHGWVVGETQINLFGTGGLIVLELVAPTENDWPWWFGGLAQSWEIAAIDTPTFSILYAASSEWRGRPWCCSSDGHDMLATFCPSMVWIKPQKAWWSSLGNLTHLKDMITRTSNCRLTSRNFFLDLSTLFQLLDSGRWMLTGSQPKYHQP